MLSEIEFFFKYEPIFYYTIFIFKQFNLIDDFA